jgi:hypothetical protein
MTRFRVAFASFVVCACGPGRSTESGSGTDDTETSEATESSGDESGETSTTETGDEEGECLLVIRIDLCCNQPYPATPDELGDDPCIVAWPIDWAALPEAVASECVMAQPEWCQLVDCTYSEPASEIVEPDGAGGCQYVCPIDTHLAYLDPGCGEPPPVVHCLGIPPPCADEYCSCEGQTIYGCGQVAEPFAHVGPCE